MSKFYLCVSFMRKALIILILGVYSHGILAPFFTYVNYWLRKDYITQTACENKDKPEMNCEGKCQLTKQLAKEVEQEQDQTPQVQQKFCSPHIPVFDQIQLFNTSFTFSISMQADEGLSHSGPACPESPPWLIG